MPVDTNAEVDEGTCREPDRGETGAGSCFRVPECLARRTIFALTEEPETLAETRLLLGQVGTELTQVAGPADADLADLQTASLLLVDTAFGESNGVEYYRNLKNRGSEIPAVFLAREYEAATLLAAGEFGAEIVFRPFTAHELLFRCCRQLATHAPPTSVVKRNPARVLVAEDDRLTATFLATSLSNAGFEPIHMPDGDRAIDAIDRDQFDAVVLDVEMPGTDGYGVLRRMRLGKTNAKTPALMLTSRSQEQDIVRAFELGADDYVHKPFSPLEIVARLRRLTSGA